MSDRVEGKADERRRLHEALDRALDFRDAGPGTPERRRRLNAILIDEVVAPAAGGSFMGRFLEGFDEHIKEAGADPADYAGIEWRRRWLNDPLAAGAVRRGLANWMSEAGGLLPEGLAVKLQVALLALNAGEDSWLAGIKRGQGHRAKMFTRERFALIFCQEVEYLAGLRDWTKGRAFFELTGNRPRRDGAIFAEQRRTLAQPPVSGLRFHTYELLRRLVPKPMLDTARTAGEAQQAGRKLTDQENIFLAKRSERLAAYNGALAAMWRDVQEGASADSSK